MKVELTDSASFALRSLQPPERRRVIAWIERLGTEPRDERVNHVVRKLGFDDLWILRAGPDIRLLFRIDVARKTYVVVDIVRHDRLERMVGKGAD